MISIATVTAPIASLGAPPAVPRGLEDRIVGRLVQSPRRSGRSARLAVVAAGAFVAAAAVVLITVGRAPAPSIMAPRREPAHAAVLDHPPRKDTPMPIRLATANPALLGLGLQLATATLGAACATATAPAPTPARAPARPVAAASQTHWPAEERYCRVGVTACDQFLDQSRATLRCRVAQMAGGFAANGEVLAYGIDSINDLCEALRKRRADGASVAMLAADCTRDHGAWASAYAPGEDAATVAVRKACAPPPPPAAASSVSEERREVGLVVSQCVNAETPTEIVGRRVEVTYAIAADGLIDDVKVAGSGSAALHACVTRGLTGRRVSPSPDGKPTTGRVVAALPPTL